MSIAKKYKNSLTKVDQQKKYSVEEAFKVLDTFDKAKFDETVDVSINLGVDPKKSDQMVRGSTPLPNGLGKKVKVLVFAKGEKVKEAEEAGAEFVGADEFIEKIQGGWLEFDKAVATPDMMGTVSKVAKVLGPRGLMPNPKTGTVSFEVGRVVKELKAGKVDFKIDKAAILHAPIGKRSFGAQKLKENFTVLMDAVQKSKPSTAKGIYIKTIAVSGTMTPSVKIDANLFR